MSSAYFADPCDGHPTELCHCGRSAKYGTRPIIGKQFVKGKDGEVWENDRLGRMLWYCNDHAPMWLKIEMRRLP